MWRLSLASDGVGRKKKTLTLFSTANMLLFGSALSTTAMKVFFDINSILLFLFGGFSFVLIPLNGMRMVPGRLIALRTRHRSSVTLDSVHSPPAICGGEGTEQMIFSFFVRLLELCDAIDAHPTHVPSVDFSSVQCVTFLHIHTYARSL